LSFSRHVPACLHREHVATLALLDRLDAALGQARRPPPPGDAAWAGLAAALAAGLAGEIDRHFAFEESALLPLLAERGDGDIAAVLAEEHVTIRAVAERLRPWLAAWPRAGAPSDWAEFRALAGDLVERLSAHVQKEELALLPALDDALDPDADAALFERYQAPS
jgi:iron-sulfur cluster repair protein YtfE (RIC family)